MRDHLGQFNMSSGLQFARGVLLLDDCEGTFNWGVTGTAGECAGSFETAAAFVGTKGIQLRSGTTTPLEDDYAVAARGLEYPESGLLVCRAKVCHLDSVVVKYFGMLANVFDGARGWRPEIRVVPPTPAAQYRDSAGNYVAIPDLAFNVGNLEWMTLEMVLDLKAMEYVSARWGGVEVDLAGKGLYTNGAAGKRGAQMGLTVCCAGAAEATMYYDSIYAGEFLNI